jgi:hypothetical protein
MGHPFARTHRQWRERVPFCIPHDPSVLEYEPLLTHSAVTRTTHDKGVTIARAVPAWTALIDGASRNETFAQLGLPAARCPEDEASHHAQRLVISRDVERGVRGASLRKHSHAFLASRVDTYPGITPNIGSAPPLPPGAVVPMR